MENMIRQWPWLRVLLYFLTLWVATIIAGIVPALSDFWFFGLVSVMCSWLMLRAEGKTLAAIPLLPRTRQHWVQLAKGTLSGIGLMLVTTMLTFYLTGDHWRINITISPVYIMVVLAGCLWSSVVQEFAFRGYPFQSMLHNYNAWIAQLVIAIPFGLMHIQPHMSPAAILITLLTTGIGSLLFGLAFIKARHLALPIGLHFGWNFAQTLIPRTAGDAPGTLVVVSGNLQHYTFLNVVGPYMIVMATAVIVLYKLKP